MKMQSVLFDKAKGSMGNVVAVQGPDNVIYMRSKNPNPVNPNTTGQQQSRGKFKGIAQAMSVILVFIRMWVKPLSNNQSAYNTSVKMASDSGVAETSFNLLNFARKYFQYVKGALGSVPAGLPALVTYVSGTNYNYDFSDLPDDLNGSDQDHVYGLLAAYDVTNQNIIGPTAAAYSDTTDLVISVPEASAAVFFFWAQDSISNKWTNQKIVGYKAAAGHSIVTA